MKELENIHTDRYYTDLVMKAQLLEERVLGTNEDGETQMFYGFEDAVDEADYEGYTLEEYGEAYFYQEGKVYMASVYVENNEGVGINELEKEEIIQLIAELIVTHDDDEEWFYSENEWAKAFTNK
jgi:hypothetical protein